MADWDGQRGLAVVGAWSLSGRVTQDEGRPDRGRRYRRAEHVTRVRLTSANDSVVNVDKLTYAGNLESLAEVSQNSRYVFERVDIRDHDQIDRVLREHQPDAIMHLAAESHVDRSISGPSEFIQTNIIGTYTLLEVARHYWAVLDDARSQLPLSPYLNEVFPKTH